MKYFFFCLPFGSLQWSTSELPQHFEYHCGNSILNNCLPNKTIIIHVDVERSCAPEVSYRFTKMTVDINTTVAQHGRCLLNGKLYWMHFRRCNTNGYCSSLVTTFHSGFVMWTLSLDNENYKFKMHFLVAPHSPQVWTFFPSDSR